MSPDRSHVHGKSGLNTLVVVLLPMVTLVAVGGGWLWHSRASQPSARSETARVRSVMHLDIFVLNLAGSDERAYLRAGIDLGLRSEPKSKASEAGPPVAEVRDTILSVLAAARPEEVLTLQGKQNLKANLLRALRERIPDLEVEEVYFTEFLIQR